MATMMDAPVSVTSTPSGGSRLAQMQVVRALDTKLQAAVSITTNSEPRLHYMEDLSKLAERSITLCKKKNPCKYRGICKDLDNGYECECYEDFYENQSSDCQDEKNHCESNPCKNGGTCEPVWGNYFCTCDRQHHGRNCELQNKQGIIRTSRPQFLYDVEQYVDKIVATFLIFDGEVGSDFSVTYSTERTNAVKFSADSSHLEATIQPSVVKNIIESQVRDKVPTGKKMMLYFPYQYSQKEDVESYEEVMTVQVKNGGEVQFSGEYKIHIIPDPEVCIPTVVLSGCGDSTKDINKWERGKKHTIHGHVLRRCNETSKLVYTWGLYTLSKDVPYPLFNRLEGSNKKSNLRALRGRKPEYIIEPYSMSYGVYGLVLQVQEKIGGSRKMQRVDHDMCWFSIVPNPIIADLAGGSEQTISNTSEIILNAMASRDPNEPYGVRDHLIFSWSCSPKTAETCKNFSKFTGQRELGLKPIIGDYTFTVTVKVNESMYPEKTLPASGTATQVVHVIEGKTTKLSIECVKNCGSPQGKISSFEVLYLKVVCNEECDGSDGKGYYKWTAKDLTTDRDLILNENNTELGEDVDKLIIKENVLSPGSLYTVSVRGGINGEAAREVIIRESLNLEHKECTFQPTELISAVDLFSFHCDYPEEISGFPLKFEVYQTPDLSHPEAEILISYLSKPQETGLVLMAGKANSYRTKMSLQIEDHFGASMRTDIAEVTVKPLAQSPGITDIAEACKKLISGADGRKSLETYVRDGDVSGAVRLISALVVALDASENTDEEEKQTLKEQFVNALNQIPVYYDLPVKQVASVLHLVLGAGQKKDTLIPHGTVLTTSRILETITNQVYLEVTESYEEMQLSTVKLMNTVRLVMETVAVLLSSMVTGMDAVTVSKHLPESMLSPLQQQYPVYFDLEPAYIDTIESYKVASKKIITVIENIGKAVLRRLGEEQIEKTLDAGSITSWIKVDKPSNLADRLIGLGTSGQGMKISGALAEAMENVTDYIGIQVTIASDNPLKWNADSGDINTGLLLVNVWNRETDEPFELSGLPEPIDLYFTPHMSSNTDQMAEGTVSVPLKAVHDKDLLEAYIMVHKIASKKGQTPYLKLRPLDGLFSKLQVVVSVGVKPSVEDFEEYSETIPHSVSSAEPEGNDLVVLVDGVSHLDNDWFYVSVLPHPEILEVAAHTMDENYTLTVNYSFQIRTLECHVWNMRSIRWHSNVCQSGNETTLSQLHCRCSHLSVFSGSVLAPSSSVDLVLNTQVQLIFEQNFVVPYFVVAILAVYCLLLLWACWKDKRDPVKTQVTILRDNCPACSYAYLVAVYTGHQRNAGSTSNIGIQLVGDKHRSMAYILADSSRTVHSRRSDDWFVLFTPHSLGSITQISLWHDCSGHYPAWYCDRVVVRDVQQNKVWTFLVHRWLSVTHEGSSLSCAVHPATVEALYHWRVLFTGHLNLGYQEQHVWYNIFLRHPRSSYTRVQRLTVALSIIMTTMMTNILLFSIPTDNPAEQLEDANFQLFGQQLLSIVAAAFITKPITSLFVLLFRKTAPKKGGYNHAVLQGSSTEWPPDARDTEVNSQKTEAEIETKKWWTSVLIFIMMEPLIPNESTESEDRPTSKSQVGETAHGNIKHTSEYQKDKGCKQEDKSSYWFPLQFIYVIWMLCVSTVVISVFLLVFYGLKLGQVRSKMWVAAGLIALLLSILVVQPLKVVIFAYILSVLLKKQPSMYPREGTPNGWTQ